MEKSIKLKLAQFKGMLRFIYMDAPSVASKVEQVSFDHKSMIKLAENYHNKVCDTYECVIFQKSAKPSLFIEPIIGLNMASMRLRNSSDKGTQSSFTAGVRVHFTSIKFKDNWHFITGLNFSHVSFDTTRFYRPHDNPNNSQDWLLTAEYSYLQLPLALSYSFGSGKIKPYVLLGGEALLIIAPEYSATKLAGYRRRENHDFRKLQIGFKAGAGLRYQVNPKMQLVLEGTYESRAPAVNIGGVFDTHYVNAFQISTGVNFKLR